MISIIFGGFRWKALRPVLEMISAAELGEPADVIFVSDGFEGFSEVKDLIRPYLNKCRFRYYLKDGHESLMNLDTVAYYENPIVLQNERSANTDFVAEVKSRIEAVAPVPRFSSVQVDSDGELEPRGARVSGLNVLRIGISRSYHSYLDFVKSSRVSELKVYTYSGPEKEAAQLSVELAALRLDLEEYVSKFRFMSLPKIESFKGVLAKYAKVDWPRAERRKLEYVMTWAEAIQEDLKQADVIWLGDNDVHKPCEWVAAIKLLGIDTPVVLSYKETRFVEKDAERFAVQNADAVIFPHASYRDFFDRLYGVAPRNMAVGDVNWHLSDSIKSLEKRPERLRKSSFDDGVIKICVLTGRISDDVSSGRFGNRYSIEEHIRHLVTVGGRVYLHTGQRSGGSIPNYIRELTEGDSFVLGRELRLTPGNGDYAVLLDYDYGFMHPPVDPKLIDLVEFQKVNIPNRYYEYVACGIKPLVVRGTLPIVEGWIAESGFGIVFSDYNDLRRKIENDWSTSRKQKSSCPLVPEQKTFLAFSDAFMDAVECVRSEIGSPVVEANERS